MADTPDSQSRVRSVVGTATIPADDPDLTLAKAAVRALFEESLERTARQLSTSDASALEQEELDR